MNRDFKDGIKDGLPIGLGYLSVSFTFGIMAAGKGLFWWQAVLISLTCLTSAGQLAGIGIMVMPGRYLEMLISQLTINVRYSFMSVSLAQKVEKPFRGIYRWLLGFIMTDEIYAVAVSKKEVTRAYFSGLGILPIIGWTFGTLFGVLIGSVLPDRLLSALSIAIYAMFIAIVMPEIKKSRAVAVVAALAVVLSCAFTYIPGLKSVPAGIAISICAVVAALVGALVFPVEEEA
ncbi:MAG: AzlC family ABC transporter permease [Lachnospiraceae bacterium]|nr:AzlC family ABC transporter permease [Lachnospiraceae bacterium]